MKNFVLCLYSHKFDKICQLYCALFLLIYSKCAEILCLQAFNYTLIFYSFNILKTETKKSWQKLVFCFANPYQQHNNNQWLPVTDPGFQQRILTINII